jgi:2-isopropylmalate synthase
MFSAINRKVKRMALRYQKAKPLLRISDTTLRDGCQTPGVRLNPEQKATIAVALADAGIHSIDCGFPAAGPVEMDGVKRIAECVKGPFLSVHARTKREDVQAAAEALGRVSPMKRAVTIFIGVSPIHREHKHSMTRTHVIDAITQAIDWASAHFELINFGPEDASRTEPDFLTEVYEAAIQAGALSVGYTDTVGILTPRKAADAIKHIQDTVPSIDDAMIGVHFHNDLGLATANALACVKAGVNMVQGTINGIGERAGNTAIEEVVLAMTLHQDEYKRPVSVDPAKIAALSRLIAEMTHFVPAPNKAVVGRNIFRTETGVHQDGMLKHALTYMPFPPELIGAGEVEFVLGPNSGRNAVRYHLQREGLESTEEHVDMILNYLKNNEHPDSDRPEVDVFLERMRPFLSNGPRPEPAKQPQSSDTA